jgi:dimethylhistidine N-methyltransferase
LNQEFLEHIKQGLSSKPKSLSSKYFYDDVGSRIFQEIMQMPEYYLTNCEYEILSTQHRQIAQAIQFDGHFNVIELGAGDGFKTFQLLRGFKSQGLDFRYFPIDVSAGALASLESNLNRENIGIDYELLVGDYFEILQGNPFNDKPSLYLFLGANVGNYNSDQALGLFQKMHDFMRPNDALMVGFDLKKDPAIIQQAYSDPHGITSRFNLNLLSRINREFNADIMLDQFDFYCHYNPENGEVNSFLVSLKDQVISIANEEYFFYRFETVHTELSKKYSLNEIEDLGMKYDLKIEGHFLDCKHYFSDSLYRRG